MSPRRIICYRFGLTEASSTVYGELRSLATVCSSFVTPLLWRIDWLMDWLTDWVSEWLTDWLIEWVIDGLIDWLIDWRMNTTPKWCYNNVWYHTNAQSLVVLFIWQVTIATIQLVKTPVIIALGAHGSKTSMMTPTFYYWIVIDMIRCNILKFKKHPWRGFRVTLSSKGMN